jgi:hypothetical protein
MSLCSPHGVNAAPSPLLFRPGDRLTIDDNSAATAFLAWTCDLAPTKVYSDFTGSSSPPSMTSPAMMSCCTLLPLRHDLLLCMDITRGTPSPRELLLLERARVGLSAIPPPRRPTRPARIQDAGAGLSGRIFRVQKSISVFPSPEGLR